MASTWTPEQILALAPDAASAKAGRNLASEHKWLMPGSNEAALWGQYQGSAASPYQVSIDLAGPAFQCTCPSRKVPCKHALGLFLLFAGRPAACPPGEPPAWTGEWLAQRAQQAERRLAGAAPATEETRKPAGRARRSADRQARVTAGLAELELWLRDLVRQGLATASTRPARYWDTMAARLVDAQAPGLARLVHEAAAVPGSGEGWTGRLLTRLGRLYLLLEGYKRLDSLPPPVQADIRTAIGWTTKEEELLAQPGVQDTWTVLGRRTYEEERLRVQRTWLYGRQGGGQALILQFAFEGQPLDASLVPGTSVEAELVFYPGNYPLRAVLKQRLPGSPQPASPPLRAYPSIAAGQAAYAQALAGQPWLELFPALLAPVHLLQYDQAWFIRDEAGQVLPLLPQFNGGWQLMAVAGGYPVSLFGEWDGHYLLPLSAWAEGRFISLGPGLAG